MNMETLRKAADVLGVLADSLRSFPEEIQAEICDAMKSYEATNFRHISSMKKSKSCGEKEHSFSACTKLRKIQAWISVV